jgi:hypothetical protein
LALSCWSSPAIAAQVFRRFLDALAALRGYAACGV